MTRRPIVRRTPTPDEIAHAYDLARDGHELAHEGHIEESYQMLSEIADIFDVPMTPIDSYDTSVPALPPETQLTTKDTHMDILDLTPTGGPTKRVGIKFIGGKRASQTVELHAGTTAHDILQHLGLDASFQLADSTNERTFKPNDVVSALVDDGTVLHVSSIVTAGD